MRLYLDDVEIHDTSVWTLDPHILSLDFIPFPGTKVVVERLTPERNVEKITFISNGTSGTYLLSNPTEA